MAASMAASTVEGSQTKKFKVKIGPPFLISFERGRIISARALQIYLGAPILVSTDDIPPPITPVKIARKELYSKVLPLAVRRKLPDGTYQDIPVNVLL